MVFFVSLSSFFEVKAQAPFPPEVDTVFINLSDLENENPNYVFPICGEKPGTFLFSFDSTFMVTPSILGELIVFGDMPNGESGLIVDFNEPISDSIGYFDKVQLDLLPLLGEDILGLAQSIYFYLYIGFSSGGSGAVSKEFIYFFGNPARDPENVSVEYHSTDSSLYLTFAPWLEQVFYVFSDSWDTTTVFRPLWSTGDTTWTTKATADGWYWISLSNDCDTVVDSVYLDVTSSSETMEKPWFFQTGRQFSLLEEGEVAVFNMLGQKVLATRNKDFVLDKPGIYILTLNPKYGARRTAKIVVRW